MRRTLHLVTARDCLALRPLHQPMLVQRMVGTLRRRLPGVDLAELARAGEALFARRAAHAPRGRPRASATAGRTSRPAISATRSARSSPLVQVPPRGVWGRAGPARNTTVEAWLGTPSTTRAGGRRRSCCATSPPTARRRRADMRAWSGLAGLRAAVARLRPRLRSFRDERGRELLDLPDAPLPDPDTPAPPRFLPAFDNAVLGFDDRSADHRRRASRPQRRGRAVPARRRPGGRRRGPSRRAPRSRRAARADRPRGPRRRRRGGRAPAGVPRAEAGRRRVQWRASWQSSPMLMRARLRQDWPPTAGCSGSCGRGCPGRSGA